MLIWYVNCDMMIWYVNCDMLIWDMLIWYVNCVKCVKCVAKLVEAEDCNVYDVAPANETDCVSGVDPPVSL